jgi:hypothetical protein
MVADQKFHCASGDKFWSLFLYFESTATARADSVSVYFHMTEKHQALYSLVTAYYCMLLRLVQTESVMRAGRVQNSYCVHGHMEFITVQQYNIMQRTAYIVNCMCYVCVCVCVCVCVYINYPRNN